MIIYYKNSVLASIVSILGCLCILVLIMGDVYDTGEIVFAVILGVGLLVAGKLISVEKSFKTWWKQIKEAGLEERIKFDAEIARLIYNKNPKKRTLKEIEKLNPAAAQMIRAQLARK